MARIKRVNLLDVDIDWVCACGEENEFTRIITTNEVIECVECGRRFRVNVNILLEDAK